MFHLKTTLLALSITLAFAGCGKEEVSKKEIIRPVRTLEIGVKDAFTMRKYPGKAEAADSVTMAFELSGKLKDLPVDVGDFVKRGQKVASLDPRDFENQLEKAQAELKRAKALYDRMDKAAKSNAVSAQELSNAQASYESAQASYKIAKKAVEDTKLIAPYDAIVVATFFKNYSNVNAKQNILRLVDPTNIEMTVQIPEDIIQYAKKGLDVVVQFDAFPNVHIPAKVSEVGAEASSATRTYPVTLLMKQPKEVTILPGMSGKAWVSQDIQKQYNTKKELLEVPIDALVSKPDGTSFVWVLTVDETGVGPVKSVPVQLGDITKTGVMVKGLEKGLVVVTAGAHVLKEGQKVRLLK